jgi:hypothetical protein
MTTATLDLPPELTGPAAWYGKDMAARTDWIEPLDQAEIAEIDAATKALAVTSRDFTGLTARDFVLPRLAPRLRRMLRETLEGRGFVLLRGLPVEHWSLREAAVAFLGLGAHLGSVRSQNARGHVLGHVMDMGLDVKNPNVRIYQTHERQTFHTDSCDIVALLCLKPAKRGGHSALVSSTTIFNEMRRRAPQLLEHLFRPVETDRRGEVPEGQQPYFTIPTFNWFAGQLSAIYQRQYIESARRFADVKPLSPEQKAAYDLFDELANDPDINLQMEFHPGDVQLVHNHVLLHDRTSFEDWPEPERRRHLLRLWLAPQGARPLPSIYAQRYGSITPGDRGGVMVRGTELTVPFEVV